MTIILKLQYRIYESVVKMHTAFFERLSNFGSANYVSLRAKFPSPAIRGSPARC